MKESIKSYKGLIITTFLLIVICGALSFLLVFLNNISTNRQKIEIVSELPSSGNDSQQIDEMNKFIYASISKDDTLILKSLGGERKVISLNQLKWKDILWNTSGTLVSVLGLSSEGKYNIYVYNLAEESFKQVTFYKDYDVSHHFWKSSAEGDTGLNDSEELYFVQGSSPERWLHGYNYSTNSQIIKLNRVVGNLVYRNSETDLLIFQNGKSFFLHDQFGKQITNFRDLRTLTEESFINVVTLDNTSKIGILSELNNFYTYDIADNQLSKPFKAATESNLFCNDANKLLTYSIVDEKVLIKSIDSDNLEVSEEILTFNVAAAELKIKRCFDGKFLINETSTNKWFSNNQEFPEIIILEGDIDADIAPKAF